MEQLIQALTAYTSTLEQQIAALEARVAHLEAQLENCELAGKINQLEQQLTEQATLIATLEAQPAVQPTAQAEEPEIEVELVMEDEEEILDTQDGLDVDIPEEIEETTEPEPVVEFVIEPIVEAEPKPVVTPVEQTPQPVVEVAPMVEPTLVVEKPAPRPTPTQTSLFGSAVEDIRQAISLGDRFLFQRELFAGNGELMQKTLDELNGLGSLSEAMEYVAETFDWDKESTAVQLFENVLKRRFA